MHVETPSTPAADSDIAIRLSGSVANNPRQIAVLAISIVIAGLHHIALLALAVVVSLIARPTQACAAEMPAC